MIIIVQKSLSKLKRMRKHVVASFCPETKNRQEKEIIEQTLMSVDRNLQKP